jgi:hypothetical protein
VHFVYLNEGLLYTEVDKSLYVYSESNLSAPIASYEIDGHCYSCIIADNQLFLGGEKGLYVFKVTISLVKQPLELVTKITTESRVIKILRVNHELLASLEYGSLLVVDLDTCNITSNNIFIEGNSIYDIMPINDSQYLLASKKGLMKTTKDQLIKHYY